MSETTPEQTETTEQPPQEGSEQQQQQPAEDVKTFDAEYVDKLRKEAAKYRTEARTNSEAAKRLQEIEEAQKSEQQKIIDRQAAIERERDEAKADGLRYKAAAKYGIGEDYFDLLGSGDEESIAGRAERVGTLIRENAEMKAELEALRAGKPAPSTSRPTAALKPGATPEDNKTEDDVLYESLYGSPTSA